MGVYELNPFEEARWGEVVRTHPAASVFHTPAWLDALQRTYGYEPIVFTTCPPDTRLTNGIVVCRIRSWLTGRRLVSVPFADHCEPLLDSSEERGALLDALHAATRGEWKYAELRPVSSEGWDAAPCRPCAAFRLHVLDLRGELGEIHGRMHPSSVQRKIRRAEREGLRYEEGRSRALLNVFYDLLVTTRRRHGLPPPPVVWFANLIACLGDAAKIRVAFKDTRPIASVITLRHGDTLTYKYGGSDASFHNLGAMPFLFWRAIQDAKALGLEKFDLGRSGIANTGLITFKEHLGAVASTLTYYRYSARPLRAGAMTRRRSSRIFAWLPRPLLVLAGRALYRHIA